MRLRQLSCMLRKIFLIVLTGATLRSADGFLRSIHDGLPKVHDTRWSRSLHQSANQPQCAPSWLGYQCTQLVCGRIRIHWSLGGDAPSGPNCSYAQTGSQVGVPDASAQVLHIALQTDVTGYVATSWPHKEGKMFPADAVIGFLDNGSPTVRAYGIQSYFASGVTPDVGVVISNTGLEVNATALTVCFSRNITQVGRVAGIKINPAEDVVMNFVASKDPFPTQHKHGPDYQCAQSLWLLSSPGDEDDHGWRPSNVSGNAANGEAIEVERLGYMRTHGALEFTGWIVLVPLGVLAARHRWVFSPVGITGLWFQVHRAVQVVAMVLVVTGFILPWTTFDSEDAQLVQGMHHNMEHDALLESHERLAITLMVALGLHIAVAILRPKPDGPWRPAWNQVHWWTGRALAVLAGVNVAIGIVLWRRVSSSSGVEWIAPLAIFAVGWIGLAAWLERRAPEGRGRDGGSGPTDGMALTNGYLSSSPGEVPLSCVANSLAGNSAQYTKL